MNTKIPQWCLTADKCLSLACQNYARLTPCSCSILLRVVNNCDGVGRWYRLRGGVLWQVRNVLLTVALFCGPMLITFSFLNTVAIAYHSTAALPFGTICVIFVLWALITFPLTVVGGIAGKNKQVSHALLIYLQLYFSASKDARGFS